MAGYADEAVLKPVSTGNPVLADVPTPLRNREAPSVAGQEVCILDACPWDSLAQFLTLPELEWVCCASASLHTELTIEESAVEQLESENVEPPQLQRISRRKLLAPLLVLKIETAEFELQRVSLANVHAIRVWNHRCLDMLSDAVSAAGGPQVLRSLQRIALKGCPLVPEVITSFVIPAFSVAPLMHLNLERNQVTDDILCNLVESGALDAGFLESINLRFNKISSRGVQALASSPCCASLKWVNLKMNQVGDDGAIALAEMLEGNSSMSLLNLRRQTPPLTDRTAFAFARTLKHNSALEQLRLRQNRIGDAGAMALAAEVSGHVQRLQSFRGFGSKFELDLEHNRIKENGAAALLESLSGISRAVRVELLVHGNWVKPEALVKAEPEAGGTVVATDPRLSFESKAEGLLW